jgi:hypothetical protein
MWFNINNTVVSNSSIYNSALLPIFNAESLNNTPIGNFNTIIKNGQILSWNGTNWIASIATFSGPTGCTECGSQGYTGSTGIQGYTGCTGPPGGISITGTSWGEYLYWNTTTNKFEIASDKIILGNNAGLTNQGDNSIAIGNNAGQVGQGNNSIAIGNNAGGYLQGDNSIAIGQNAGVNMVAEQQASNSIVLNGSSTYLSAATGGFYVKPIRNVIPNINMSNIIYNNLTSEISLSPQINRINILPEEITSDLPSGITLLSSPLTVFSIIIQKPEYVQWNGSMWFDKINTTISGKKFNITYNPNPTNILFYPTLKDTQSLGAATISGTITGLVDNQNIPSTWNITGSRIVTVPCGDFNSVFQFTTDNTSLNGDGILKINWSIIYLSE